MYEAIPAHNGPSVLPAGGGGGWGGGGGGGAGGAVWYVEHGYHAALRWWGGQRVKQNNRNVQLAGCVSIPARPKTAHGTPAPLGGGAAAARFAHRTSMPRTRRLAGERHSTAVQSQRSHPSSLFYPLAFATQVGVLIGRPGVVLPPVRPNADVGNAVRLPATKGAE